jgi:hypothetical protein
MNRRLLVSRALEPVICCSKKKTPPDGASGGQVLGYGLLSHSSGWLTQLLSFQRGGKAGDSDQQPGGP